MSNSADCGRGHIGEGCFGQGHELLPGRETAYLTITLAASDAQPADLQEWIRREWFIENQVHHVRYVTFREDSHQARTGHGPAVMATLRNAAIGFHRSCGETNIARATRRASHRPHDLITAVTSSNPRTQ